MSINAAAGQTVVPPFDEYATSVWPWLYRCAYLLAGTHADAEDLAQQTLLRAHLSWSKVGGADSPRAYLRRILTNVYLSQRRSKLRRLELLSDAPPEPIRAQIDEPNISAAEHRLTLWPHIVALPPRQRAVVVLRYYEQLSEREIAEALGCSAGNVKSTAHRALKALRLVVGPDALTGEEL